MTLALAVPAAGFLLRTFIVFHDCAHGSFFRSPVVMFGIGPIWSLMIGPRFWNSGCDPDSGRLLTWRQARQATAG